MKTSTMFALLMSAAMATSVQAEQSSVDFRLDPIVGLSSSGSVGPDTVGAWLTPNAFSGYASVQYTSADGSRSWNEESFTSDGLPAGPRNGEPFGPRRESVLPASGADLPSAHSLLEAGRLQADATRPQRWDDAAAGVNWDRTFSLLPNTSITFSGTATLGADRLWPTQTTFEASPNLNAQYANRGVLGFHSVADDGQGWRNGISVVARIMNFDPRLPAGSPSLGRLGSVDDFAYSNDEEGHVSLTLFNHSDELMFTNLSIGVFASAPYIPAVPEPAAWLTMLLGLGALGSRRMKIRKWLTTALAAAGLAGAAHAESISVDFQLDPITGLSTDSSSPAGTVGHWITPNSFFASETTSYHRPDQTGSYRSTSFGSGRLADSAVGTQPFGNFSRSVDPVAADAPSARLAVEPGHLRAEISRQKPEDTAETYLSWRRAFTLDPNSSITLSGLLAFNPPMPLALVPRFSTTPKPQDTVANTAWFSFRDDASWGWGNGISIVANILNQDPRDFTAPLLGREPGPDDFAYSADPQGHLSLTIFNRSDQSMFGSFEVLFLSSLVQAPIPEPSTWLAMLLGLAVLFWRGRPVSEGPGPAPGRSTAA
ncbi:PEP-CTERM sorting domain-containing protein [Rhizobacter sp. P5_C2]